MSSHSHSRCVSLILDLTGIIFPKQIKCSVEHSTNVKTKVPKLLRTSVTIPHVPSNNAYWKYRNLIDKEEELNNKSLPGECQSRSVGSSLAFSYQHDEDNNLSQ